ncbi:MAG TPA: hypothetical protein VFF11_03920 [Candidatus Binatia bacterium]|nr:hypothetical protein [Candidatus Binatia bacterium]
MNAASKRFEIFSCLAALPDPVSNLYAPRPASNVLAKYAAPVTKASECAVTDADLKL